MRKQKRRRSALITDGISAKGFQSLFVTPKKIKQNSQPLLLHGFHLCFDFNMQELYFPMEAHGFAPVTCRIRPVSTTALPRHIESKICDHCTAYHIYYFITEKVNAQAKSAMQHT